jgi:hypothetical protein
LNPAPRTASKLPRSFWRSTDDGSNLFEWDREDTESASSASCSVSLVPGLLVTEAKCVSNDSSA